MIIGKLFKKCDRGDTLVEVAIAISVLGLMLAASMAAINRNLMTIMNSAERTAIRSQIDSQAELLRYAWNNNIRLGASAGGLSGKTLREALREGYIGNGEYTVKQRTCGVEYGRDAVGGGSFWLAPGSTGSSAKEAVKFIGSGDQFGFKGANENKTVASVVQGTPTTGGDNGKVAGIWIDAYSPAAKGGAWYVDFYIRACWTPYGSPTVGTGRMQTIVRFRYSGNKYEDTL